MDYINGFWAPLSGYPFAATLLPLAALLLVAWLANFIIRRVLLRIAERMVTATAFEWDDALLSRGVLSRLVHAVPALIIAAGIVTIPGLHPAVAAVVHNVAMAYVALTIALSISNLLDAVNDLYVARSPKANERPIKGYLQVVKIIIFVLAAVLMISALISRSPALLLSGFGAMSAVLMLVFKDSILSLVASVQLGSNDMLRVGDWIEMPSQNADGDVIDMALNTVKVQNWDKTITTVPTYKLISESFKNWRGMQESGGRRIKRALLVDQSSVRFLAPHERDRLRRIALIDPYLDAKRRELEEWNHDLIEAGKDPVNTRRVTNIGTFRAYVEQYLRAHPGINQGMTLMVRQLAPGPTGLPLELYCFTASVAWADYENTQSDIFDHLIAMLPEFGLRLYQAPGGADLAGAFAAGGGPGPGIDLDPDAGTATLPAPRQGAGRR
ncbi:mechanosensitive ion channel family protein [Lysobacter sp. GX 14042]|uniref:mechanosensitive ion channel family protein n=1 Tax=Lysobacter sp. GX 14042 TaxID=2907155 RepID=UPI001F1C21AE|nr:mechanosensitive ion channel domain-containing protein [Lysobacter sp. GX 14042]MCE7033438.1 mechanosensitive ion channel family protein [Lysobacter sp. GX 14042]